MSHFTQLAQARSTLPTSPICITHATTTHYANKPIAFILLADTLRPKTRKLLAALESKLNAIYPTSITIYNLSQQEFSHLTPWSEAGANWCAYFRLKIGDVLDPQIQKCLYLDTDTLILSDIREIFYHDLQGNAIGAVRSGLEVDCGIVRDGLIDAERYCNSGVLVIDMPKWREKDMSKIQSFPYTDFPDQDFLNVVFKDSIALLPYRWNLQWLCEKRMHFFSTNDSFTQGSFSTFKSAYSFDEFAGALLCPAIVHLLGSYKPWEKQNFQNNPRLKPIFTQNPYHKLWWILARKSPFIHTLRYAYYKRVSRVVLSAYTQAYTPRIYSCMHLLKRTLKRILKR
ncbi:general stress protein A [Helicobacter cinaedi]|uniref:glycosyltransferase family 8 protein n=1 Tax=Helicobacter cinaedi TaxID=213 RepID=UPI001F2CF1E6|nr:glycosyltransferase [Helicobacter cinaedi]BDB66114.1 general stress protein A [Helicobacter cinaedi]